MKAMIFAAGLGSRLKPYTLSTPKALVKVAGKPLLEWIIIKLKNAGIREIIINVHHFAEQIEQFLHKHDNFGAQVEISDERSRLLDTGGGLKKASWFLDQEEPFLVHNVDIISTIDLRALAEYHLKHRPLATLAVKKRPGSRFLLVNRQMQLCGWQNVVTGENRLVRPGNDLEKMAFSGIHIIEPGIFQLMQEEGVFSITELYLRLASGHILLGYPHQQDYWNDLGKPDNLLMAEKEMEARGAGIFC